MKRMSALLLLCALTLALLCACGTPSNQGPAVSQPENSGSSQEAAPTLDYPKYTITINSSKAGSTVDYMARAFAKTANELSNVSWIVNSCAGQVEAVRETLGAEADGYTVCLVNNTVLINDVTGATDFNSVDDVDIIAEVASNLTNWIAIKTDLAEAAGIKTLNDLMSYTKDHPGELLLSDRAASNTYIACRQLLDAGLDATPADVGTTGDRFTNFLAGSCDIFLGGYDYLEQYIETGEVLCLAVMSSERSAFSPDVPCTAELGYPELGCPATYYVCAPKGLPEDVLNYLSSFCEEVTKSAQYEEDMHSGVSEVIYKNSADAYEDLVVQRQEMIDMGMGDGYQG